VATVLFSKNIALGPSLGRAVGMMCLSVVTRLSVTHMVWLKGTSWEFGNGTFGQGDEGFLYQY